MAVCAAGLTLAACASDTAARTVSVPGAVPAARHSTQPSPAPAAPTPAHNRQLTVAETRRLLARFALPGSAARTTARPKALGGPAMGTPGVASLVDAARYWHVPMSLQQAGAWVAAHPPRGLKQDGSSRSGGPDGPTSIGYSYLDDRSSSAWVEAELEVGIAPAGAHASTWRVDGIALWLDPRPQPAPAATRPLRVAATGECPADDRNADGVPPGPSGSLLPAGTPDAALVCTYTGRRLTAHRHLGAAAAARLATLANGVTLAHVDGAVFSCPAGLDRYTAVAFGYPDRRRPAELWLAATGCATISNGTIMAQTMDDPGAARLLTAVGRLTG